MKKEIQNFEELESFLKQHNYTYPKTWKTKLKKIMSSDSESEDQQNNGTSTAMVIKPSKGGAHLDTSNWPLLLKVRKL